MQPIAVTEEDSRISAHARTGSSGLIRTVAYAGTIVGFADALDAFVFFGIVAKLNPIQVLQFVASGALGAPAFEGGLGAAALGFVIHFALAYGFAGLYALAHQRWRLLQNNVVAAGFVYGAGVWLFMNLFVLPVLTKVNVSPPDTLTVVHGMIMHGITVGLVSALCCQRWLGSERS